MRMNIYQTVLFLITVFLITSCDNSTPQNIEACELVKRWLKISPSDYNACLDSKDVRESFFDEVKVKIKNNRIISFNKNINIPKPNKQYLTNLIDISNISDLPRKLWKKDAKSYAGKTYKIRAKVKWSEKLTKNGGAEVVIFNLLENKNKSQRKSISTDIYLLNDYQKNFIEKHCWRTKRKSKKSLCTGDVYIMINYAPKTGFLTRLIIGVDFDRYNE